MEKARSFDDDRDLVVKEAFHAEQAVDELTLEVLPWDTEFFGFRVARADLTRGELERVVERAQAGKVECVYLTVDGDHPEVVQEAILRGARLVQFRLKAHRDTRRVPRDPDPSTRLARPADRPKVLKLARELSSMSRFAADPRFPQDRVADLYEHQMVRCLESGVVAVPTDDARGVCAVSVDGSDAYVQVAYIDPSERHRALGQALILTAMQAVDAKRVYAAAKASNMGVIRTSLSLGFRIREFAVLMHLWLDELRS